MVSRAHSVVAPRMPMSPAPKPNRRVRTLLTKQKITMFVFLIVVGAIVSVLAVRYTTVYVQNAGIQKMEQNIQALREQNARLRTEIAQLQSPKRLIETGIKLGLVFPSAQPKEVDASTRTRAMLLTPDAHTMTKRTQQTGLE